MKLSSYLSLVFAALLSSSAWAAGEGAIPPSEATPATEGTKSQVPQFTSVDKDKSGSITAEEAVAVPGLTAAFPKVDSNADANISEDEYAVVESGKNSLSPGS